MVQMTRRGFVLGAALAACETARTRTARALARGELVRAERTSLGTTLTLSLPDVAPFPAMGASYTDSTVLVFIPAHLAGAHTGRTAAIVHFHGHNSAAGKAISAHRLREQLVDSKQDAILIVPQGPVAAASSACGKLEQAGGFKRLVHGVFAALVEPESASVLGRHACSALGTVCISAHSGGYHAAAQCLKHGGLDVTEVWLFDALYAEAETFVEWVDAGRGRSHHARHKLVTYYTGGATEQNSLWLAAELEKRGAIVARETVEGTLSRETLTRAEAIAIRSAESHEGVTSELNALRDCLYASALPRRLKSSWFEARTGSRPMERRR